MEQGGRCSISQFFVDMMNRSLNSQLGHFENFVLNLLRDYGNFQIASSLLFSAFQQDLLSNR
jgi:hypothetical protein